MEDLAAENARLKEENASLLELLSHRDEEVLFLRRRLASLRCLVSELDRTVSSAPPKSPRRQVPLPPPKTAQSVTKETTMVRESSFPGVKLRRETVLQQAPDKLALKKTPTPSGGGGGGAKTPQPWVKSAPPKEQNTEGEKKTKGSWLSRKK